MIVEICQAVNLGFFVLKMDEDRCGLREDFQSADVPLDFVFLFSQIGNVLPIPSSQNQLKLFLLQFFFNFIKLFKVGKLIFIPTNKRYLINRPKS